jgi:hypothetical protein
MTPEKNIQQEIERTLQSLDGIQRAEVNPYLYTRIKARMQKDTGSWEKAFSFISRPIVALTILVLVMAINGLTLFNGAAPEEKLVSESSEISLPEFENEYRLITSVENYDYENLNNE